MRYLLYSWDLRNFKVQKLKEILNFYCLSTVGSKQELLSRIDASIDKNTLGLNKKDRVFLWTESGAKIVDEYLQTQELSEPESFEINEEYEDLIENLLNSDTPDKKSIDMAKIEWRKMKHTDREYAESEFFRKHMNDLNESRDLLDYCKDRIYSNFDSQDLVMLCNRTLKLYKLHKRWCESQGAGGIEYFKNYYERLFNSSTPRFKWIDEIRDIKEDYLYEYKTLRPQLLDFAKDGFLQKTVYSRLPNDDKYTIQNVIRKLENEGIIHREKKSGSYYITLTDKQS